jgi:hypothetical protein
MLGHPPSQKVTWLKRDPDFTEGEYVVEFRLTYEGLLLGSSRSSPRVDHKHTIRRAFHPQLRRLWQINPHINAELRDARLLHNERSREAVEALTSASTDSVSPDPLSLHDALANNYARCGYRFVPLITRMLGLTCAVRILFLRSDPPGQVLKSGDIDNRLKTLFDALRIVNSADELGRSKLPGSDEDPFYCLLEDDSLINHLSVETDTLLQPTGADYDANDARLVITVQIKPIAQNLLNLGLN